MLIVYHGILIFFGMLGGSIKDILRYRDNDILTVTDCVDMITDGVC